MTRPSAGSSARPAAGSSAPRAGRLQAWQPWLIAAAGAFTVAILGGLLTDIGPWYLNLRQPPWKPPDWAFGPIWTTIFALATVAGVGGWRRAPDGSARRSLVTSFAVNGGLNALWSLLFFHLQRPDWALIEVPLLWLSVLALIVVLWRYARVPAVLLLPYLLWVSIASVLNWNVVQLNGPFGASR